MQMYRSCALNTSSLDFNPCIISEIFILDTLTSIYNFIRNIISQIVKFNFTVFGKTLTKVFQYLCTYVQQSIQAYNACMLPGISKYLHTWLYINTIIYLYVHSYIHIYIIIHTYVHMHRYIYTYIHTGPCTCTHIHIASYIHMLHIRTYTYMHVVHSYMYTYKCMYKICSLIST